MRALVVALFALAGETAVAGSAVRGVRMSDAADHTRFVFDLSAPTRHTLTHASGPDRLIIDVADSELQGSLQTLDLAHAPVSRIRSGKYGASDLRVVLDLAVSVEAKSFLLPPGDGAGHRLVVDVYPKATVATAPASAGAAPTPPSPEAATPAPTQAPATSAPAPAVATAPVLPRPVPSAPAVPERAPLPPSVTQGRDILIAVDAGHGGDEIGRAHV